MANSDETAHPGDNPSRVEDQTETVKTGSSRPDSVDEPGDRVIIDRPLGIADTSFYLIGIGASAGGLDAIRQVIAQIPDDFRHSLVIIQHISPDYKSMMADILSRDTNLQVQEVADDMAVEPGQIYLIPPRSNVIIQGTTPEIALREPSRDDQTDEAGEPPHIQAMLGLRFSLVEPMPRPQLNLPIDLFFKSLAEAVGDRAIGIILSGSGSDGSRGLRSIKDRDGLVICQTPGTAEFDGMPRAALETGIVDLVLAPDSIVTEVMRFLDMRAQGILTVESLFKGKEQVFQRILQEVSDHADIDFSQYKEPTLKRRIARRVALTNSGSLEAYLEIIEQSRDEASMLHGEFLVAVTNFFRDRGAWQIIEEGIIPKLFSEGDLKEPIKVWSVGCSTGEEAYSIAMVLEKYRQTHGVDRDFRVIATDANPEAIEICRQAIYPERAMEEIPEEYRRPEFVEPGPGILRIPDGLRAKITFRAHNAVDETPYIRTDLLICRNVLIYLSPEIQQKLLTLFAFSLRQNGYLFLGAAENVHRLSPAFSAISDRHRIFLNRGRTHARAALVGNQVGAGRQTSTRMPRLSLPNLTPSDTSTLELLRGVLDEIEACTILVSQSGNIIETFGTSHKTFLKQRDGAFSSNLLDLLDNSLKGAVSLALRRLEARSAAPEARVRYTEDGQTFEVDVQCRELEWHKHGSVFAVTLRKTGVVGPFAQAEPEHAVVPGMAEESQAYIFKLEAELASTQDMLAASFEDLGTANEELQASNEELQAANEELQANNEEVQSVNEELHTVNAENVERIAQLEGANTDIQNLLDDDHVGKVLLDSDMRIRRFTTGIAPYVDLKPHDLGRPIANFSSSLMPGEFGDVLKAAEQASRTGEPVTLEVNTEANRPALVRAAPFHTSLGRYDGAVVTFIDTSDVHALQDALRQQKDILEGILESQASGYWDWNLPAKTEFLSPRFKAMLGYEDHEMENTPDAWQSVIHPDDLPGVQERFEAHVKSRGAEPFDQEVRYFHRDGSIVWVIYRGRVIEWDEDGNAIRMAGVHVDITDLKKREMETRAQAEEVRRFAFVASHDLLQPMNTIENAAELLQTHLGGDLSGDAAVAMGFLTKAAGRMKVRIGGVLEYASLQEGSMGLESVDLAALCDVALDELSDVSAAEGAEISVGPLPRAMGVSGLLTRVFVNLIGNAIKYRHANRTPRIVISEIKGRAGFVTIEVRDNGIGVPEEHSKKIFQLFARLHSDRDYEGNGLGLALCERIIEKCGGSIRLRPGDEGGAAFVFDLPDVQ